MMYCSHPNFFAVMFVFKKCSYIGVDDTSAEVVIAVVAPPTPAIK